MTSISERKTLIELIQQAYRDGARVAIACEEVGISERTYRRWYKNGEVMCDQRPFADRPAPRHALTKEEKEKILEVYSRPEFTKLPPSQIVARLADMGIYIASKSSFYRVLREFHRDNQKGSDDSPGVQGQAPPQTMRKTSALWP